MVEEHHFQQPEIMASKIPLARGIAYILYVFYLLPFFRFTTVRHSEPFDILGSIASMLFGGNSAAVLLGFEFVTVKSMCDINNNEKIQIVPATVTRTNAHAVRGSQFQ